MGCSSLKEKVLNLLGVSSFNTNSKDAQSSKFKAVSYLWEAGAKGNGTPVGDGLGQPQSAHLDGEQVPCLPWQKGRGPSPLSIVENGKGSFAN